MVRFRALKPSQMEGWLNHTVKLQPVKSLNVAPPAWEAALMALAVVSAVALAAAVLAMLVQRHLHKTLLSVSAGYIGLFGASRAVWVSHGANQRACVERSRANAQTFAAYV